LAGGFLAGHNIGSGIIITDTNGRRLKSSDPILPESVITARTNNPMFYLTQYVAPVLTIVSTILSILIIAR